MSIDVSWSNDSRKTRKINLGLVSREFAALKSIGEQFSDDLDNGNQMGTNSDAHSIIRGIVNGSLNSSEVDGPLPQGHHPDNPIKSRFSISDKEYQKIVESGNIRDCDYSSVNTRDACIKLRQNFIVPFLNEVVNSD